MFLTSGSPTTTEFLQPSSKTPCHLVPSSRIRLLATAVAAPLHPALSLACRLMVLMVAPLEYPMRYRQTVKAKLYEIYSDTNKLQLIKLQNFKLERLKSI